ncbi:MAG: hypothetical protein KAX50_07850 [Saprospiraceae bacterium]|nr:hypothetical protein [Saprospiraceae bacterium]
MMLYTKHQAFQESDTLPKSVGQNYLWRKSCGEKCGELRGKCGERGISGRWAVGSWQFQRENSGQLAVQPGIKNPKQTRFDRKIRTRISANDAKSREREATGIRNPKQTRFDRKIRTRISANDAKSREREATGIRNPKQNCSHPKSEIRNQAVPTRNQPVPTRKSRPYAAGSSSRTSVP